MTRKNFVLSGSFNGHPLIYVFIKVRAYTLLMVPFILALEYFRGKCFERLVDLSSF